MEDREHDLELAAGVRQRDRAVVDRLVTDLTPAMLRLARAHTGSSASAEDVVQDAWLTVLTGIGRFEGRSALRTWVLGIVVHKARRAAASDRRLLPLSAAWAGRPARARSAGGRPRPLCGARWLPAARHLGGPAPPLDLLPECRLAATELRTVFEAALSELPVRQRAVLTARDVLGLSAEDVAGLYGLSEGNQRVLLHRGRSRVRAAVEQYLWGPAGAGPLPADPTVPPRRGVPSPVPAPRPSDQPRGGLRPGSHTRAPRPRPGQAVVCQQLVELVDDCLDGALDPDLRRRPRSTWRAATAAAATSRRSPGCSTSPARSSPPRRPLWSAGSPRPCGPGRPRREARSGP